MTENDDERVIQRMSKELMETVFKFEIGDLVVFRADLEGRRAADEIDCAAGLNRPFDSVKALTPMMVVGRLLDECPGGTQRHYRLAADRTPYAVGGSPLIVEQALAPFAAAKETARQLATGVKSGDDQ